jgi:hypothetical protein
MGELKKKPKKKKKKLTETSEDSGNNATNQIPWRGNRHHRLRPCLDGTKTF